MYSGEEFCIYTGSGTHIFLDIVHVFYCTDLHTNHLYRHYIWRIYRAAESQVINITLLLVFPFIHFKPFKTRWWAVSHQWLRLYMILSHAIQAGLLHSAMEIKWYYFFPPSIFDTFYIIYNLIYYIIPVIINLCWSDMYRLIFYI